MHARVCTRPDIHNAVRVESCRADVSTDDTICEKLKVCATSISYSNLKIRAMSFRGGGL